jgi:hypothetical protein
MRMLFPSNQFPIAEFALQVSVIDGSDDQAAKPERNLHHQHRYQEFPSASVNAGSDYPGVEEVFEFVDDHQEYESEHAREH